MVQEPCKEQSAKRPQLHVVSDGKQSAVQLVAQIEQLHEYVDMIHIREKTKPAQEIYHMVEQCLQLGVPAAKLAINDRVDVAAVFGLSAHLAWHSLPVAAVKRRFPEMTVGASVHSLAEAEEVVRQGVDYVLYGHIYRTGSKPGQQPRGLSELARMARGLTVPVLAIGGITPENAGAVLQAGAAGVAVMSGIWQAERPQLAAEDYRTAFKRYQQ